MFSTLPAAPSARIAADDHRLVAVVQQGREEDLVGRIGVGRKILATPPPDLAGILSQRQSRHPHRRFVAALPGGIQGAEPDRRIGLAANQLAEPRDGQSAQRSLDAGRGQFFRRLPPLPDVSASHAV